MNIEVILDEGAKMPTRAYTEDAGFDLYTPNYVGILGRGCCTIDTGVHMLIPKGYVGFLKSKSGLNVRLGIRGEGVIDAGYTGSIVVKLYNDSDEPVIFEAGQKIIQIVILPIPYVELKQVDTFPCTHRGASGLGSSGKF